MKKSKILIPALSIASLGAVVAPIVTSCNGKSGVSTVTIAMTDTAGTGYVYNSPMGSIWNFGAGQTVKYTGVKMVEGAKTIGIVTSSQAALTGHEITSVKINGTAATVSAGLVYTIPGTPAASSELSIEVVYKAASQTTAATVITLYPGE